MHPSIGPVAEQFRITTNLFMKAMSGVDADEAMRRPGPVSNPLLWLAGHVTPMHLGSTHSPDVESHVPPA